MGFPFFSFWPHTADANRHDIVLTEDLSDLQITPIRDVSDAVTMRGNLRRATGRPSIRVRILLERFTDRELFRRFSGLINHLERGGWCSFGLDDSKAYGALTNTNYYQGTRRFYVEENQYKGFTPNSASTTSLAVGDEIVIESPPPVAAREYFAIHEKAESGTLCRIDIDASGGGTTNNIFQEDYPPQALVRHSDFYPKLFLPASGIGGGLLTHDHRIAYTLDLQLEYVIPNLQKVLDQPEPNEANDTTNDTPQGGFDNAVSADGSDKAEKVDSADTTGGGGGGGGGGGWTKLPKGDDDLTPKDTPEVEWLGPDL